MFILLLLQPLGTNDCFSTIFRTSILASMRSLRNFASKQNALLNSLLAKLKGSFVYLIVRLQRKKSFTVTASS